MKLYGYNSHKVLLTILSFIIGFILLDNFLSLLYFNFDLNNQFDIIIFPIISIFFVIGQIFIVKKYVIKENKQTPNKSKFIRLFSKIITVVVVTIISFVVIQVITQQQYFTSAVTLGISASYVSTIILFSFLAYRLLSWYREEKEFIILIYAMAMVSIVLRIGSYFLLETILLVNTEPIRNFQSEIVFLELLPNTFEYNLGDWYSISSIVSFLLLWFTNALFLRNYYKKFSQVKYFMLVCLLPSFTMIDFVVNANYVETQNIDPLLSDLLYLSEGTLSGILLALPYFIIARSTIDNDMKHQLKFAGCGLIIFTISGSTLIDHAPFPPFGFISIISMQLAALIIYVSLYKSALSFSMDSVLRKSINNQMHGIAHLLQKIGSSEMNRQILNNTIEAQQRVYDRLSEVNNLAPTMDSQKIKDYIEMISEEIKLNNKNSS